MQLKAEQLAQHLKKGLAPIYLIYGDELLLVQEAADAIRAAARAQDFSEREVFNVDREFDWNQLIESSNNLSLFAERRILEVRMPTGKPGDAGGKALREYAGTSGRGHAAADRQRQARCAAAQIQMGDRPRGRRCRYPDLAGEPATIAAVDSGAHAVAGSAAHGRGGAVARRARGRQSARLRAGNRQTQIAAR